MITPSYRLLADRHGHRDFRQRQLTFVQSGRLNDLVESKRLPSDVNIVGAERSYDRGFRDTMLNRQSG